MPPSSADVVLVEGAFFLSPWTGWLLDSSDEKELNDAPFPQARVQRSSTRHYWAPGLLPYVRWMGWMAGIAAQCMCRLLGNPAGIKRERGGGVSPIVLISFPVPPIRHRPACLRLAPISRPAGRRNHPRRCRLAIHSVYPLPREGVVGKQCMRAVPSSGIHTGLTCMMSTRREGGSSRASHGHPHYLLHTASWNASRVALVFWNPDTACSLRRRRRRSGN